MIPDLDVENYLLGVDVDEPLVTPPTFGERLEVAIRAAGKTQTRTERECDLGQGRIHRLLGKGKSPITSPGPDLIRRLADYLGVQYEWLAIGRGPMRGEFQRQSPLESAMTFALFHGARRDAIDAAVTRYRDAANMTGNDWILAFNNEAIRLDRENVPRPEQVEARLREHRRLVARRQKATESLEAAKNEITSIRAEQEPQNEPTSAVGRGKRPTKRR